MTTGKGYAAVSASAPVTPAPTISASVTAGPWRCSISQPKRPIASSATNAYRPLAYVNALVKSLHQWPCSAPKTINSEVSTKPGRLAIQSPALATTAAIVT